MDSTNKYFNYLVRIFKPNTTNGKVEKSILGDQFYYEYNGSNYCISLMFGDICIFKKGSDGKYLQQFNNNTKFNPVIKSLQAISNAEDFLKTIELETFDWN